jgi:hypothetical protein
VLLDYSMTKGGIHAFTKLASAQLIDRSHVAGEILPNRRRLWMSLRLGLRAGVGHDADAPSPSRGLLDSRKRAAPRAGQRPTG